MLILYYRFSHTVLLHLFNSLTSEMLNPEPYTLEAAKTLNHPVLIPEPETSLNPQDPKPCTMHPKP